MNYDIAWMAPFQVALLIVVEIQLITNLYKLKASNIHYDHYGHEKNWLAFIKLWLLLFSRRDPYLGQETHQ